VQVILGSRRFVCLVSPEHTDIKIEAREIEIVWVAAKLGDRKLRCENQTHVVVAFVVVKIVDATVVQRYHVAADALIRAAALLELSLFGMQSFVGHFAALAGRSGLNFFGYVANFDQLVEFEIGALALLGGRCRGITDPGEILLLRGDLFQTIDNAVVIRHHQSLGEINDAEHPPAMRSDDSRTWSSQSGDGANPYLTPTVFDGKLSNVHMPSSACAASPKATNTRAAAAAKVASLKKLFIFIVVFPLA